MVKAGTTKKKIKGVYNLQPYEIDASLPPMEIVKRLPEGMHAEVIDGVLFYVEDPPTPYHQRVYGRIAHDLADHVEKHELGEVWHQPVGVFFEDFEKGLVMPDLTFISKNNPVQIGKRGLLGVPDLLVEILSPSTRRRDLSIKKDHFEKVGVKEYWIVDPNTKNSQGYLLENKKYGDPLLLNSEIYIRILKKSIKF